MKPIHFPTRRGFLKLAGATATGLLLAPRVFADDAAPRLNYSFVNKTSGKWTDNQMFWSLDNGTTWHSFAKEATTPCPDGGGRVYLACGSPPKNFDDRAAYWDFIEWNYKLGGNWSGNTTQVDAFCLPLTIELGPHKVGIDKPRTQLFKDFSDQCPEPFKDCVKGDFWILSPARAGFRTGGKHAEYFTKYIDEIWDMYATKKATPSGKYTGEVKGTALTFTPTGEGQAVTCDSKPSTQDVLLGEGVLGKNAAFCGALNRHVAADPADWRDVDKFYKDEPCNWYAKFLHTQTIDHKCYGFCYDDASEQAAYFSDKGDTLTVTVRWD